MSLTNYTSRDLDPVSQILKRRVVELRRAITKNPEYEEFTTNILKRYAALTKHDKEANWYHTMPPDHQYEQRDYPQPAQHPAHAAEAHVSTIKARGPTGLLLQSLTRIGAAIDVNLNIKQYKEQNRSVVHTPYQFPRPL